MRLERLFSKFIIGLSSLFIHSLLRFVLYILEPYFGNRQIRSCGLTKDFFFPSFFNHMKALQSHKIKICVDSFCASLTYNELSLLKNDN